MPIQKNKEAVASPRTPRAYSASKKAANQFISPFKKGGTNTTIPKGYHKMPDGTIMKDSAHKMKKGGTTVVAGGEKHIVYKKTTKKGEGKIGNIMVNHPTKDKGQWDTIDLTAKGRAKTVKQGVAATKKWHKDNPDYKYNGKGNAKKKRR